MLVTGKDSNNNNNNFHNDNNNNNLSCVSSDRMAAFVCFELVQVAKEKHKIT